MCNSYQIGDARPESGYSATMVSLPENPRALIRDVVDGYARVDLLTYANAIAFQVLFALIPFALMALGLAGFLGLDGVYEDDLRDELSGSTSPNVFIVLDDTFRQVLGSGQLFWITVGLVFTVWKISGAMRAVMGVFENIYDTGEGRGIVATYRASILLALAVGVLLSAAVIVTHFLPGLLGWPLAVVLMTVTVALIVHYAPSERRPWQFVSLGTGIVVVAWIGTSVAFGFYVTELADYGSIFGNLATVIIVFEYLYLAAVAFLTGALLDTIVWDDR